jgi:hypothetical protein
LDAVVLTFFLFVFLLADGGEGGWFCWRLSCVLLSCCCVVVDVWFLVEHTENVDVFGVYSISSVSFILKWRERKQPTNDSHRQRMSRVWGNWPHLIWDSHM